MSSDSRAQAGNNLPAWDTSSGCGAAVHGMNTLGVQANMPRLCTFPFCRHKLKPWHEVLPFDDNPDVVQGLFAERCQRVCSVGAHCTWACLRLRCTAVFVRTSRPRLSLQAKEMDFMCGCEDYKIWNFKNSSQGLIFDTKTSGFLFRTDQIVEQTRRELSSVVVIWQMRRSSLFRLQSIPKKGEHLSQFCLPSRALGLE